MTQIDILPDDALLEIFDFHRNIHPPNRRTKADVEAWISLVHVCRRWRTLVLGSPRRLNLRLFCTPETTTKDRLDVFPTVPLIVAGDVTLLDTDNIVAALGQSNRVCDVSLMGLADRQLDKVLATMQVPFPELTELSLCSFEDTSSVIPDSFLGGSAPRLLHFELDGISFPNLPNLLLSTNHLVSLSLTDNSLSGRISPETIIALLSVLTSLKTLLLEFHFLRPLLGWESRSSPLPKRSILPALDQFYFEGVTEYLEDLVTFMDAPQLKTSNISFTNQIDVSCPRLGRFINCTSTLSAPNKARVQFDDHSAIFKLQYPTSKSSHYHLLIEIPRRESDLLLSSIGQVCNSFLHTISTVEDLYIERQYFPVDWENDAIGNTLWFQLLLPFTAVKNLYLSKEFAPCIAAALRALVGGSITRLFPSLQNIFVEGLESSRLFQDNIEQFVAARHLSGHPFAVSVWDEDSSMNPTSQ